MIRKGLTADYGERLAPLPAAQDSLRLTPGLIWVEPRETSLAPVGEGFLFKSPGHGPDS